MADKHVDTLKETMTKAALEYDLDVSAAHLLTEAVEAMNDLGRYRGHSPYEFMPGRTPEMGAASFMNDGENAPLMHKLAEGDAEEDTFIRNMRIRIVARPRVDADQKLARPLNARGRTDREFSAGDVVFYWRNIRSGKRTKNIRRPGARGCWLGPALIIAASRRVDGSQGSNVFVEASGRLIASLSSRRARSVPLSLPKLTLGAS